MGGLDLIQISNQMGVVATGVAFVLFFMSFWSVGVAIERIYTYKRARTQSKLYAPQVAKHLKDGRLTEAIALSASKEYRYSHLAKVVLAGLQEYQFQQETGGASLNHEDVLETVRRSIQRATALTSSDLNKGVSTLATIGSSAAFVGLLGTVVGVINAFVGIASTGSGGIGAVSAGIAEALIETAMGLFVAIPAVWWYHFLTSRVEYFNLEMDDSSSQVADLVLSWTGPALAVAGGAQIPPTMYVAPQRPQLPLHRQEASNGTKQPVAYPERVFLFRLCGDKARGQIVESGGDFDLVFAYESPTLTDLTHMRAKVLEQAVEGDLDVEVAIVPRRLTITDGLFVKVAKFRNGRLTDEVVFKLSAQDASPDAGVHVFLSVKGCLIYEFPVPIKVVKNLDEALAIELPRGVPTFNLDAIAKANARAGRDVRLVFSKAGGQITVAYTEFGRAELKLALERIDSMAWNNLLKSVGAGVGLIASDTLWNSLADPLTSPADSDERQRMQAWRNRLISEGSTLYKALSQDSNFKHLLQRIEELQPGSRISILSNCGFLPFDILYPQDYHFSRIDPPTPPLLWGYRFRTEYLLYTENAGYTYEADLQQGGRPFVSLNLDTSIDTTVSTVPGWRAPFPPAARHRDLLTTDLAGWHTEINEQHSAITATLSGPHAGTLIYYYCHGKAETPFGADPIAKLKFGGTLEIDPSWIDIRTRFVHSPIIILNSCASGETGPLSLLSFLERFRQKGAVGLVSTWFAVPMMFASGFGRALLRRYAKHEAIGEALFELRRDLLKNDNPLGFLYALQCPMDVTAPALIPKRVA